MLGSLTTELQTRSFCRLELGSEFFVTTLRESLSLSGSRSWRLSPGTSAMTGRSGAFERLGFRYGHRGGCRTSPDRAPNDEQVRHQHHGKSHRRQEAERGTASLDDGQRQNSGDQATRQHPEQQLGLLAANVTHHPATALHGDITGQHQRNQDSDDRNDVFDG